MEEEIVGILSHVLQSTGGIGSKHYTIITTNQRLIIAQFTAQMMNEAMVQSKNKGGKGFLGGLLAGRILTPKNIVDYTDKYLSMPPEQIIAENPGNFSLDIPSISVVKVEYQRKESMGDDSSIGLYILTIDSIYGQYSFIFDADPQDMDVLRKVLGNKLIGSGRSNPVKPVSSKKGTNKQPPTIKGEIKFCTNCGQKLSSNANFCSECGKTTK